MKRYLFLVMAIAFALLAVHDVYADSPPGPLTQQAQEQYDALPVDVQVQVDYAMRTIPAEDWEGLIAVTVDMYTQNNAMSSGCSVSASVWRSYYANRVYGSSLTSCSQSVSFMSASVTLTNPSNGSTFKLKSVTHTSAVMSVASLSYQSGYWSADAQGTAPGWSGSDSAGGSF